MENGCGVQNPKWRFSGNEDVMSASVISIRGILMNVMSNLNESDKRPVIPLGHGDPSAFPCYRTSPAAEEAVSHALRSANFNGYATPAGFPPARRAISEYLSKDLPHKLSPDDIYLTSGCTQAVEIILTVLTRPNANILLPRPGYPFYEARAAYNRLEARHFDLLPERGWEVDLVGLEALADENTVAMVIINPGNPCGNVFTYDHLKKVAETAKKLGILIIADEVYDHLVFGSNPFVPMAVFASTVPVITVGSISKRWNVPGWRLGWIGTNDINGTLQKHGIIDCIKGYLNISSNPATFIQGAIPQILENTPDEFFSKIIDILKEAADVCDEKLKKISCITCANKAEGSMFVMVKLNLSLLEDIKDDIEFCAKVAKEESVIFLPGVAVGMKNWLRVTFAIDPSSLAEGLGRVKAFCERHAKKRNSISWSTKLIVMV